METCKNCGTVITDIYCPHCGQGKITGRLEVRYLFSQVTSSVFHWESSFFRTFKEMFLHPGKAVQNYIDGKHKSYVKPFSYFIFIWTIYVFVYHWINGMLGPYPPGSDAETTKTLIIFEPIFTYGLFIQPLIFALILKLFTRKKTGLNYAESLVFSFYVFGTVQIFEITRTLCRLINDYVYVFGGLLAIFYAIYAVKQFSAIKGLKGILKGILIYITAYLAYLIIVILFFVLNKYILHFGPSLF